MGTGWERGLSRDEVAEEVRRAHVELERFTNDLQERESELASILADGVRAPPVREYESRARPKPRSPNSVPGPESEPRLSDFVPAEPDGLRTLVPGWQKRHEAKVARAHADFAEAHRIWKRSTRNAERSAEASRRRYEDDLVEWNRHVESLARMRREAEAGTQAGVEDYVLEAFRRSVYSVAVSHRVRYLPSRRELLLEVEVPLASDVVPSPAGFKYVKTRHAIEERPRSATASRTLYRNVLAQVALRSVFEVLYVDDCHHIDTVALKAVVEGVDPANGRAVRPMLLSLRVGREEFLDRDFERLDPVKALQGLRANLSSSPVELVPVTPVIEFDVDDPRFIDEQDIVSGLNDGINLIDLTPDEFEQLITNLFNAMDFDARPTRHSKDGGVDCIAYFDDPVKGGKYVVQAKRWTHTIQVEAVRDLAGAMDHERASNGILVTTSTFAPACREFARGKPLRLIDGSNLLDLIQQYTDIKARIVMPRR